MGRKGMERGEKGKGRKREGRVGLPVGESGSASALRIVAGLLRAFPLFSSLNLHHHTQWTVYKT